jgi:hypothetical protein
VTRVEAWVDGRRIAARRGRNLRRIRIPRPIEQQFTVKLLAVQSTGKRTATERPFTGMGCYPGHVTH